MIFKQLKIQKLREQTIKKEIIDIENDIRALKVERGILLDTLINIKRYGK